MARLLWISLGGAVGTAARYLLSLWVLRATGPGFPWGTLAVNTIGSFLLGLLMQIGFGESQASQTLRLALTTGAMGGFTTYSTFNYEMLRSFEEGAWPLALANLSATVFGCLAAGLLGVALGRWLAAS
ncbi:MAG TPA: CrcB family protein [Thermoanaerobaculia bacterium]|nr:CrcB family protein [Thermoanaerobaculia bacterium]